MKTENIEETPIEKAIRLANGVDNLAKAMNVHPSFVTQLKNKHRPIPPVRAKQISDLLGNAVTKHELRPDVFDPDEVKQEAI